MRVTPLIGVAFAAALLSTTAVPTASAGTAPASTTAQAATEAAAALDGAALERSLEAIHEAGMYGSYASVREGDERWTGAAGLADVDTGRPVAPGMRQRVGSISKTFTAVAVLQQVEQGRIRLDAPIGDYLPDLVPGERGRAITVRMVLNHTSGIADYVIGAFPSLAANSTSSLDDYRFRSIPPEELVRLGLEAPATGEPGAQPGSYSNTDYVIAGLILEKVTGQDAGTYLTRNVFDKAGLRHTSYPSTPYIKGPHARMYESFYGLIDPPRDYSTYDMSWAATAGAVISTTDDLNRFYRALLTGELIGPDALDEMLTTVPVMVSGTSAIDYGLGIYSLDLGSCGRFWGHDGAVFGAGTIALSSRDGQRQMATGWNLMKYQHLNDDGTGLDPSPIDDALNAHIVQALCPSAGSAASAAPTARPLPAGLPGTDIATTTWLARP